jgi:hypothetical protein
MHDLRITGLSAGHVKRGPVRGMQGPLEKQKIKTSGESKDLSFCLTPAPGGSDAKAVLKHALERERKK